MRVLICPDKFAGTISAVEAAAAVAAGWRAAAPGDVVTERPLADGGPGFLEVLAGALAGRRVPVPTVDPLGRPADGWLLRAGGTAYLESAQACGLHLLAEAERDPKVTTSYGLGLLLAAAISDGAGEVVVGLGGSGTNDAGAGMLAALGAPPVDAAGDPLPYGGAALGRVTALGGTPRSTTTHPPALVVATDVDNPLLGPHGASHVFGPQKGATSADVALLEAALTRYAAVLERDLATCPPGLASLPGAGAAGGLGAGLLALDGRVESGIAMVRRLTGLDQELDRADLVITGEGSFDRQSLRGKVVAGVAAAARARGVPCVVIAGRVAINPGEAAAAGVTGAHSLVEHHQGDLAAAMARPAEGLRALAAQLARANRASSWRSTRTRRQ